MFKYFHVSFLSKIFWEPNLAASRDCVSFVECRDIWVSQYRDCWQLDWVQVSRLWLTGDHRPIRRQIVIGQSGEFISFYQLNPAKYWKQKPGPMSPVLDILLKIVYSSSVWQLLVWRFTKYLELRKCHFPTAVLWDPTYIFNNCTQTKNKDLEIIIENWCRQSSQDCLNGPRSIHHRPQFLYRDVLAVAPLKPKYQNTKISHFQACH